MNYSQHCAVDAGLQSPQRRSFPPPPSHSQSPSTQRAAALPSPSNHFAAPTQHHFFCGGAPLIFRINRARLLLLPEADPVTSPRRNFCTAGVLAGNSGSQESQSCSSGSRIKCYLKSNKNQMQFVVCQHLFLFSCAQTVSTSSKPLLLNCKRLFDSFILAQCVFFLFNSTLCVCGRNPRLSNPVRPIHRKQMTFRHSALLNFAVFTCCRKNWNHII